MRHVAQQQPGHAAQEGDQLEHSSAGNKEDDNQQPSSTGSTPEVAAHVGQGTGDQGHHHVQETEEAGGGGHLAEGHQMVGRWEQS